MLDRLFDFLAAIWEWLIPWVILDCYEAGVILRLGKYHRTIGEGLHFIIPFGIENCKYETVVRQTSDLSVQSVTTADNKTVSVNAILVYTITDIRRFLLEIDDAESDLQNICYGVITDVVESLPQEQITSKAFNNLVTDNCRKLANEYCGVNLIDVKWSDKAPAKNLRLWN